MVKTMINDHKESTLGRLLVWSQLHLKKHEDMFAQYEWIVLDASIKMDCSLLWSPVGRLRSREAGLFWQLHQAHF